MLVNEIQLMCFTRMVPVHSSEEKSSVVESGRFLCKHQMF